MIASMDSARLWPRYRAAEEEALLLAVGGAGQLVDARALLLRPLLEGLRGLPLGIETDLGRRDP
jgi:hypothetical protein